MTTVTKFGVQLSLPPGWVDSSDELGSASQLLTLTKADGNGALQFSVGRYISGQLPNITVSDLTELLSEFASTRRLRPVQPTRIGNQNPIIWCCRDYRRDEDFVRVWYISNCRSVILSTYVCSWEDRNTETADCEQIISTIQFDDLGTSSGTTQ